MAWSQWLTFASRTIERRQNTQRNDTQHNDIQHNKTQHNNKFNATLSIATERCYADGYMSVINAECHDAGCRYAECRGAYPEDVKTNITNREILLQKLIVKITTGQSVISFNSSVCSLLSFCLSF